MHHLFAGAQQTSPFGFSIPPAGGSPVPGAPSALHQLHRPPFGRPQTAYQQYLLRQYGSAYDQQPNQQGAGSGLSQAVGGGAAGSNPNPLLNDPRLLMLLLQQYMRQRELTQGTELPNSGSSSAELKAEERALMDLLNSLGDRTGLSSFTNFDRINWDFLNPFRNRKYGC